MHLQEETISENDPPQIMDFENNFMINQNGQGSQQFDELNDFDAQLQDIDQQFRRINYTA